jgi:hypothetical protein
LPLNCRLNSLGIAKRIVQSVWPRREGENLHPKPIVTSGDLAPWEETYTDSIGKFRSHFVHVYHSMDDIQRYSILTWPLETSRIDPVCGAGRGDAGGAERGSWGKPSSTSAVRGFGVLPILYFVVMSYLGTFAP